MIRVRRRHTSIKSDVNLTPLIDVMMSLLAIFMITAPLLTTGIPLDLPKGDGKSVDSPEKTLDISVDKNGKIYVANQEIKLEKLTDKITALVAENPKIQMMISGDSKADYGRVIEVMALLRASGFTQVGLKTDAKVMKVKGK
ncbi:MAG: biopolymer transporter ExbD [Alphaproteobacteria bacterium]|nr:biopolymer transporter ExbD [Alphaproteobacteria bacterium]